MGKLFPLSPSRLFHFRRRDAAGILFRMQFGICNEIFQGWSIEETFRYAAEVGYDCVEIAPFTIAKDVSQVGALERSRIRAAAELAGVAMSGIHWVLVEAEGIYLNSPSVEIRRRSARYFVDLVDFCADLGGTRVIVGSPKQRNIAEGTSPADAWGWAAETFRDSLKQAEDRGVIICVEPLAPAETNFINTAEAARQFAEECESPAISIILDVKAMCAEGKPIPEIIRESAGKFAYFHANDRNLKGPGSGDVDFVPIAAALREVGYDGVVSVEVFKFEEGPEVIATQSIAYLRETFDAPRR